MEPKIAARFLNSQSVARICPFVRGVVPRLRPRAGRARDDIAKVWQCERSAKRKKNPSFRIATDYTDRFFTRANLWRILERVFMKQKVKKFRGTLERMPGRLGWTIVRLPFDAAKLWGSRGALRVRGEMNGFEFRTSLFPNGRGGHYLLVNKKMQKGGGVRAGEQAEIKLEPDTRERPVVLPIEMERILKQERQLRKF